MLTTEAARAVLVVVYLAVIARLLTPADFGLVAMATAVLWVLQPLAGMSLGSASVQTPEISDAKLNAVFWWSLTFATALTVVVLLAAPLVGRLYGSTEVVGATRALALIFMINGIASVPFSVLQRELRFGVLSAIEFTALVVSAVVAVVAAANGLGFWSLVLHELALYVWMTGVAWVVCGWRPRRPGRLENIRPLLSYGGYFTVFRILQAVRSQMDRLIVGRLGSPAALGSYSTASSLLLRIMQRINGPVSTVAVSSLSRLQDMPQEYRNHYRLGILWTTSLSLPVACFVAFESRLVVTGLLGPQWSEAIPIFQILAIGAVAVLLRPTTAWVFRSIGRTDRQLRWGVVETVAYVGAFLFAARWGVLGIAVANAAVSYLILVPRTLYCFRHSPIRVADLVAGIWRPAAAMTLTGLVWWWASPLPTPFERLILQLVATATMFIALFAVFWVLLPGGLKEALDALRTTIGRTSGTD